MSSNRSKFNNLYVKGMFKTMTDEFKRYGDEYKGLFYSGKSDTDREILHFMSGLSVTAEKPEGTAVSYDDPIDGPTKELVHKTYGLAFRVSEEAIEDDKYSKMKNMSKELGLSARESINIQHFALFNLGTSSTYFASADAKAVFATDHVKLDGSSYSNSYTASSLSLDAIQDDLLIFENLTDHRGKKINRKGSCKLIVANPALEWKLAEIFGSIMNPDTANNAINSLVKSRPSLKFMCTPYITSTTARYYIGESSPIRGAISFMRRPVTFAREGDFNTGDSLFKVTYRMSVGCADPMNIAQNPGA